jgi:phospholipase D1/2
MKEDKLKNQYPSRLDELLRMKAKEGVNIYILLWWETVKLINTHSQWVVDTLGKVENIFVENHPNRAAWLWSHHEKLVVVDEIYAFVGGIDLCPGRWDTITHPILDEKPTLFPGIDYCNAFTEDFPDSKTTKETNLNRETATRMPWHDVGIYVEGKAAQDLAYHFN